MVLISSNNYINKENIFKSICMLLETDIECSHTRHTILLYIVYTSIHKTHLNITKQPQKVTIHKHNS